MTVVPSSNETAYVNRKWKLVRRTRFTRTTYIFSEFACLRSLVHDFVVENGKVKCQPKSNGMCWAHGFLCNLHRLLVCFLWVRHSSWNEQVSTIQVLTLLYYICFGWPVILPYDLTGADKITKTKITGKTYKTRLAHLMCSFLRQTNLLPRKVILTSNCVGMISPYSITSCFNFLLFS